MQLQRLIHVLNVLFMLKVYFEKRYGISHGEISVSHNRQTVKPCCMATFMYIINS